MAMSLVPAAALTAMLNAARSAPLNGDLVEVGVYQGGSAQLLAEIAKEKCVYLHLFDTFGGMPHASPNDKHQVGEFADTSLEVVQRLIPSARCYRGIFPDTLPKDVRDLSFVHCDVDQYVSTSNVIAHLWPRLVRGGVMWFDDWELDGARSAILDHFSERALCAAPNDRRYVVKP